MAAIQERLQAVSEDYSKLQTDLQEIVSSRQKLEAQKQENVGVKKEFEQLKGDETIYKLIGPVLLKQDRTEAESTVDGRLDFISKEISRLETQIKECQEKMERHKAEIIRLQASNRPGAEAAAASVGA